MSSTEGTNPDNRNETVPPAGGTFNRIIAHMSSNKVEAALWGTRLFTLLSCFNFLLPIFSGNQAASYQKALMASAATSALRLHQRVPNFRLSRDFLSRLLMEDSAHYLFYSILFLYNSPTTMVLVPVMLFALMHAQSYTKQLLDIVGPDSVALLRRLLAKVTENQQTLLRFIAITEILLMPTILVMMFTGAASLLQPFIYYRFLSLRYTSLRNPYSRQCFYELRVTAETLVWKPQCPEFVRNLVTKAIAFICRLAPQTTPQQPQQQAQ